MNTFKKYPVMRTLMPTVLYATDESLRVDNDDSDGTQVGLLFEIVKVAMNNDLGGLPFTVRAYLMPHKVSDSFCRMDQDEFQSVLSAYRQCSAVRIDDVITTHSRLSKERSSPLPNIARQFEARGGALIQVPNTSDAVLAARYGRTNSTGIMTFATEKQAAQYARALLDRFLFGNTSIQAYLEQNQNGRENGWHLFNRLMHD